MLIKYVEVEGYMEEKPAAVDHVSSPHYVYLRKNIEEVENKDGEGMHWKYEEAQLTLEEYQEYIAMMQAPDHQAVMQKQNELELLMYEIMCMMPTA